MIQRKLFSDASDTWAADAIPGLQYLPEYLSSQTAANLLARIDASPWLNDLKRRVQHYGFKYDYKRRSIDADMRIGPLPTWTHSLTERLVADNLMPVVPDQLIVNEYLPGQGIADHVDCEPCFGDVIVSISLGCPYLMNFTKKNQRSETYSHLLESGSLLLLSGAARYEWMHGIKGRKTESWAGQKFPRSRRVSLTFRKTMLQQDL